MTQFEQGHLDPKGQQEELYPPTGLAEKFLPIKGEGTVDRGCCWPRADASVHDHIVGGHESLALTSHGGQEQGAPHVIGGGRWSSALVEGWLGLIPFLVTSFMKTWASYYNYFLLPDI